MNQGPEITIVFVVTAFLFCTFWGRGALYVYERDRLIARSVFRLMAVSRLTTTEAKSVLRGLSYAIVCLIGIAGFALGYGLKCSSILDLSVREVSITLLGVVGELSLASLFVQVCAGVWGERELDAKREVRRIPWLKSVLQSPKALLAAAVATSGVLEEVFFRGVLLAILLTRVQLDPMVAVLVVGVLFLYQQVIQLRTWRQVTIISAGCVAISLVGGLLVLATKSVVPAALAHASFALYYVVGIDSARKGGS